MCGCYYNRLFRCGCGNSWNGCGLGCGCNQGCGCRGCNNCNGCNNSNQAIAWMLLREMMCNNNCC